MFGNVFQSSKSALAFAGAVVVSALMLVGSEEKGGVLDKAVTTYKEERGNFANNAAMMSEQMSGPVIAEYDPSGLEEPSESATPVTSTTSTTQVIRLDEVTLEPIGVVPPPPQIIADVGMAGVEPGVVVPPPPPREAVVTSRMIRIEPK
jgi:hypothetical protein